MAEVVRQISENLVLMGHEVTVATAPHPDRELSKINGVNIEEFGSMCDYQDLLLRSDYDIITNFAAQQWATDYMIPITEIVRGKKVFVPTGFSGLHMPKFRQYYDWMPRWMKKYDACVFLSNTYQDIEFARKHGITKIHIIPNGASEKEFSAEYPGDIRQELGIPEDHFLILLVGSHTGQKGHKEAIEIFKRAGLEKATLVIVGEGTDTLCYYSCKIKEWTTRNLMVLQLPRDKTVALYHAADLFLFPSNVECSPIVLFECMASRTPFLVTDVGNAREIVGWSGGGALLPTTKDGIGFSHADIPGSVDILKRIYDDRFSRENMQYSGFNAWKERFTWEWISEQYEAIYQILLETP
jgi:glycosyltransferase involved in cell wall biosynthesis